MKKRISKLFSFAIAMALVFSLSTVTALADSPEENGDTAYVGNSGYTLIEDGENSVMARASYPTFKTNNGTHMVHSSVYVGYGYTESGTTVRLVQAALRANGISLAVDGYYGPNTRNGIIIFQKKHGLSADGIVGPQTWAKLANSVAGKTIYI